MKYNQVKAAALEYFKGDEVEDDGSGNSQNGGFFSDLWHSVEKQLTDPQTIKDVFNKYVAGGQIVRPINAPTTGSEPKVKKSNTTLYVIIGVVVVAVGIGIYMATKKK